MQNRSKEQSLERSLDQQKQMNLGQVKIAVEGADLLES